MMSFTLFADVLATGVSGSASMRHSSLNLVGPATLHTLSRKHGSEYRLGIELSMLAAGESHYCVRDRIEWRFAPCLYFAELLDADVHTCTHEALLLSRLIRIPANARVDVK
jgi:hypothetical protein